MSAPRKYAPLLAILALAVVAVFAWRYRARQVIHESVLSAAPTGSWLVVTVDVVAGAPLLQPLAQAGAGSTGGLARATRIAGLGPVAEACGFEPLEHIAAAMIAIPEEGERGDFGAAFAGDLTREQLAGCAEKSIRARGGQPVTTARGSYAIVSDASGPGGGARLAFRDGGPFLVGRGAWLDAMIDAVEGTGARMGSEHEALRASLTARASAPPALLATALLPRSLRDRIRSDVDAGTGPAASFAGVLAVDQAALALSVDPAKTELRVDFRCDASGACDQVKKLIERERFALSRDFGVRLLGLGALIDRARVDVKGSAVTVETQEPTADLARALERVLGQGPAPPPSPSFSPPPASPPPAPTSPGDGG